MFRLLQLLFDRDTEDDSTLPEQLIDLAIEHTVDATDPRLRTLSGYQRRLRPAVIKAIDQVLVLVKQLPGSVALTPAGYGASPELSALFASADQVREVLRDDTSLADYLTTPEAAEREIIHALLLAEPQEHQVLGMELRGEVLQREVAQVHLDFSGQRLMEPAPTRQMLRKRLGHRAFEHLLGLALVHIGAERENRADLQRQRDLLRRRLQALESGHWGFQDGRPGAPPSPESIQAELARIEAELQGLGTAVESLDRNLAELIEVLEAAPTQLYAQPLHRVLDRMGIVREQPRESDLDIQILEVHSAGGVRRVVLPVTIPRAALPAPKDLVSEALRYLG